MKKNDAVLQQRVTGDKTADREWSVAERRKVVDTICDELAKGKSLPAICREEGMPAPRVVGQWCQEDEGLARDVAWARDVGYDAIAEDAIRIADTPSKMTQTKEKDADTTTRTEEDRKLQVETRLRLLAKWCPKRYGDGASASAASPAVHVGVHFVLTEERRAELMAKKRESIERRLAAEKLAS